MSLKVDKVQLDIIINSDPARKEMMAIEQEMKKVSKELQKLPKDTQEWIDKSNQLKGLQTRYDEIKREIGITGMTLRELTKHQKELNLVMQNMNPNLPEYKKLQKELNETKNRIIELRGGSANTKSELLNMSKAILGSFGLLFGIQELANAIMQVIKNNAQFEQNLKTMQGVIGATDDEMKKISETAISVGQMYGKSAVEVAKMQIELGKLGLTAKDINNVTGSILALSIATGEDLINSGEIATSTMKQFGLTSLDMTRITDVMTQSFNASALGLEEFGLSMKYVGPIARSVGFSVEEITAMLGVLADAGIKGEQAGTSLRFILTEVAKKGGDASEAFKQLAQNGITTTGALDEVGRNAMTALQVLASNQDKLTNFTDEMNNAAGATKNAADAMGDTLLGAWNRMITAISNTTYFSNLTNNLKGLANTITELFSDENEQLKQNLIQATNQQIAEDRKAVLESEDMWKARSELIKKYGEEIKMLTEEITESTDEEAKKRMRNEKNIATASYNNLVRMSAEMKQIEEQNAKVREQLLNESAEKQKKQDDENRKKRQKELKEIEILQQKLKELQRPAESNKYDELRAKAQSSYNEKIAGITPDGNAELNRRIAAQQFANELTAIDKQENDEKLENDKKYAKEKAKIEDQVRRMSLYGVEKEIETVTQQYDDLIALAEKYGVDVTALKKMEQQKIAEIEEKYRKEQADKDLKAQSDKYDKYAKTAGQIAKGASDLNNIFDQLRTKDLRKTEQKYKQEEQKLKQQLKEKTITQEQYDEQITALEERTATEQKKIAKKYAIFDILTSGSQIVASTAQGVLAAMAASPLTLGLPWSAIIGTTGAIQLATTLAEKGKIESYALGNLDVIAAGDGKKYNAQYQGRVNDVTLTRRPSIYLAGEKGQELIVDADRTRNIQMNFPEIIDAIRNVPQYQSGNVERFSQTTTVQPMYDNKINDTLERLNNNIEDGIVARVVLSQFERVRDKRDAVIAKMKE